MFRQPDGQRQRGKWPNKTFPLYGTARWKALRANQLRASPLCVSCQQLGIVTPATVADHVEPHGGDEHKFWNGKLQSLCKPCHDGAKQALEKTGRERGCDADGYPRARMPLGGRIPSGFR